MSYVGGKRWATRPSAAAPMILKSQDQIGLEFNTTSVDLTFVSVTIISTSLAAMAKIIFDIEYLIAACRALPHCRALKAFQDRLHNHDQTLICFVMPDLWHTAHRPKQRDVLYTRTISLHRGQNPTTRPAGMVVVIVAVIFIVFPNSLYLQYGTDYVVCQDLCRPNGVLFQDVSEYSSITVPFGSLPIAKA